MTIRTSMLRIAAAAALVCCGHASAAGSAQKPAVPMPHPAQAPIMAATHAGARIVAVGDHGMVLLSDDGRQFRQARSVPTQALLTSLSFIDDRQGWAAGHDGVILHTADGGETWTLQREDLEGDKPLFGIRFRDAQHGFAVGLFGTAVQTADGGASWTPLAVETGPATDHHLYGIFGDGGSVLCIAGEAGLVYRSTDGGATWATLQTSNPGSFWAGLQLKSGRLIIAGQRGHIFASDDQGVTWSEVPSGTQQSLTGLTQLPDGHLLLVGLAGTTLDSSDDGKTFSLHEREDRAPLTATTATPTGAPLLFGATGLVAVKSGVSP